MVKKFARDVGVVPRTVDNWRKHETLPDDPQFQVICDCLFGDHQKFAIWKAWLTNSLERARAAKTPVPLTRLEIAALAFTYLFLSIPYLMERAFERIGLLINGRNFGAGAGFFGSLFVVSIWFVLRRHAFSQIERSAYHVSLIAIFTGLAIGVGSFLELHVLIPLFPSIGMLATISIALRYRRSLGVAEILLFWFYVALQSALASSALVETLKWHSCCEDYAHSIMGLWAIIALLATCALAIFRWHEMSTLEAGAYLVGTIIFLIVLGGVDERLMPFAGAAVVLAPIGLALFMKFSGRTRTRRSRDS